MCEDKLRAHDQINKFRYTIERLISVNKQLVEICDSLVKENERLRDEIANTTDSSLTGMIEDEMEKAIIVRKDHVCNACVMTITKGEPAIYYEGRAPRFDDDDEQVGIEYYKIWSHAHDCAKPPSCEDGQHIWVDEYSDEPYPEDSEPTGNKFCEMCFDIKTDSSLTGI